MFTEDPLQGYRQLSSVSQLQTIESSQTVNRFWLTVALLSSPTANLLANYLSSTYSVCFLFILYLNLIYPLSYPILGHATGLY